MQVEWFGQSAFKLTAENGSSIFIDPFGDMSALAGPAWAYPPITGVAAELLLVTHEHPDHNGVEAIDGTPALVRSTAGRHETPLGTVTGIAAEHDSAAGTERGPNTIYAFELDGMRVVHFGDFGQSELRPEQRAAIGRPDLLFICVGGGPTIGGEQAAQIAGELDARWVVPMHYRTERIGFLEPADAFLSRFDITTELETPVFRSDDLAPEPMAIVPKAP